jgi:hypothetical protein
MATPIPKTGDDAMAAFYEKLADRLRSEVAALLPEDTLQAMVARTVEEEFFKPQKVRNPKRRGGWNDPEPEFIDAPSKFAAMVLEAAMPLVKELVREQVEKESASFEYAIDEQLAPQSIALSVALAANTKVESLAYEWINRLSNEMQSRGLR